MRGWGAAVAMVCLAGCGLTFDFEPPAPDATNDAAVARDARVSMDAAPPPFDADVLDAAPRDAVVVDATPVPDGMVIPADAGPVDGCLESCAEPAFCDFGGGRCHGPARCAPRPGGCPDVVDPVCGCDRNTYGNACEAHAAGVSVASDGECPEFERDHCALRKPPQTEPGCLPCFDDSDCTDTASQCVGAVCATGGAGYCRFPGNARDCFYDYECNDGERCEGAEIRGCPPDLVTPGRCR